MNDNFIIYDEDKLYMYEIPIEKLKHLKINKNQKFNEQQKQGRRPRFSIINIYINKDSIQPYAILDIFTGEVTRFNQN